MRWASWLPWSRAGAGVLPLLASSAARAELEVIALRYRTAEQVLPVLRPLVESGGAIVTESIGYRDATAGFEVVARVAGDRVTLDISPRRDALAAGGSIDVQRMASTASGRLGEWIELGGTSQEESRQAGGMLAGSSLLRQDVRRVWVRVEEIQ